MITKKDIWFKRGYFCAVSNIMRSHGDSVIARDVLDAYGDLSMDFVDDYDVEVLKPIVKEIKRLAKLKGRPCLKK